MLEKEEGMKKAVWLSFDLGVRGDYEGLYTWLDNHQAKECGENLAFFKYECQNGVVEKLKRELKKEVKLDQRSRIYMIHLKDGKMKGNFIFGRRKRAPWIGYGTLSEEESSDEA
jgi:hypothetical protein